jgi:chromosome segregation ATPase
MVQAQAAILLNQKNDSSEALTDAAERLVAALDRLEERLGQWRSALRAERSHSEHDLEQLVLFERENEELKAERSQLTQTISDLEGQYRDLHKVAGATYNKLEDSIKRLTRIIES